MKNAIKRVYKKAEIVAYVIKVEGETEERRVPAGDCHIHAESHECELCGSHGTVQLSLPFITPEECIENIELESW